MEQGAVDVVAEVAAEADVGLAEVVGTAVAAAAAEGTHHPSHAAEVFRRTPVPWADDQASRRLVRTGALSAAEVAAVEVGRC